MPTSELMRRIESFNLSPEQMVGLLAFSLVELMKTTKETQPPAIKDTAQLVSENTLKRLQALTSAFICSLNSLPGYEDVTAVVLRSPKTEVLLSITGIIKLGHKSEIELGRTVEIDLDGAIQTYLEAVRELKGFSTFEAITILNEYLPVKF